MKKKEKKTRIKTKVFKAAPGAMFNDEEAAIYGAYLEKIKDKNNGFLTPEKVLEASLDKKSPTHTYFDWDDSSAGNKYRLAQARELVNHIKVNITFVRYAPGSSDETIKHYHNVRITEDTTERGYVSIDTAVKTTYYMDQIIENAKSELKSWEGKYNLYKELRPVLVIINSAIEEFEKIKKAA